MVCGLEGNNQIFSMQIRPLFVSVVSCIHVVSIKSKPSAILLLNRLHKVFVLSHSVQVMVEIRCAAMSLTIARLFQDHSII